MSANQINFLYCDNKTKETINRIKTKYEWLFKNLLESVDSNEVLCLIEFNKDGYFSESTLKVFTRNNENDLVKLDSCSEYYFDKKLWFTIKLVNNELVFNILISNYVDYEIEFNFNLQEPMYLEELY
jgi:hypothetical protein